VGIGWIESSSGDSDLVSSAGLNAGFGRGCLREVILGAFSATGEGGEEDNVERLENQGYSLTVSFQTFGSDAWCTTTYTASMHMYASNINVMTHAKLSRTFPETHTLAAVLPRRGEHWLLGTMADRAAAPESSMIQKTVTQISSIQTRLLSALRWIKSMKIKGKIHTSPNAPKKIM
jgi:hypothetical protein